MPVVRKATKTLYWLPLALLISFAVYFALKWGLKPKPIPQIDPTTIENPEQVGVLTYRRLKPALRQEKMVVLGSSPWIQDYERVWNGFIAAAREDKWNVEVIYEDPALRPIKDFGGIKKVPLTWPTNKIELARDVQQHLQYGHLVIVHTTNNLSSHRGEESVSKELEVDLKRPWTSVTMLGFAVGPEGLEELQPHCQDEMAPTTRADYVACAAARASRKNFRKHLDPAKAWMAMELHGMKDYFMYYYQPPMNVSQ